MMTNVNETNISTLFEIIYELYREDIKKGKLKVAIFKDEQSVGKSAQKAKTFHQTAHVQEIVTNLCRDRFYRGALSKGGYLLRWVPLLGGSCKS